jgi:response regulator RpfG family c-di-GMP phosphodiesterase
MIEAPKSVLIVDDNDSNREILARRLESLNLNISVATNGRQALEMIYTSQFDLVLLDIMMPEINGYEVLQHLKSSEITNHLPIIVTSGIDDVKSIARCINLGAEDYLIKPINNTLLNARISTALEKKQLRDQENHYRRQIEDYNSQLESRVREQVREISASQMAIIYAMAKMAEFRDMETGKHIERVRDYCNIITHDLVASGKYRDALTPIYMENIINASPLHDIG